VFFTASHGYSQNANIENYARSRVNQYRQPTAAHGLRLRPENRREAALWIRSARCAFIESDGCMRADEKDSIKNASVCAAGARKAIAWIVYKITDGYKLV
jgi:hypothetical protein